MDDNYLSLSTSNVNSRQVALSESLIQRDSNGVQDSNRKYVSVQQRKK